MSTAEKSSGIRVDPELQEVVARLIKGVRDPEAMQRAAERMDRMRDAMHETNIAVDLIREARDEE